MSRELTIVFAVAATVGFSATNSWGQCGCSNGTNSVAQASAQTYQRFSYEPSAIPSSQSMTRTTASVPMIAEPATSLSPLLLHASLADEIRLVWLQATLGVFQDRSTEVPPIEYRGSFSAETRRNAVDVFYSWPRFCFYAISIGGRLWNSSNFPRKNRRNGFGVGNDDVLSSARKLHTT